MKPSHVDVCVAFLRERGFEPSRGAAVWFANVVDDVTLLPEPAVELIYRSCEQAVVEQPETTREMVTLVEERGDRWWEDRT